jgi:hypothetical protein
MTMVIGIFAVVLLVVIGRDDLDGLRGTSPAIAAEFRAFAKQSSEAAAPASRESVRSARMKRN